MNINGVYKEKNTYDAIVIGSGISGGWAAKELTEKGLKTLVLERGRMVEHIKDYTTAHKAIWEFPHRNKIPRNVREENPIVSRCYAFREATENYFVKDDEHPYEQEKPFDWIKGYQVGGKSLMWARHTQRWSDLDFEANAKEGVAVDWPIRYKDLAPWYSYVEKFAGISGNRDGLDQIPDGEFLPPMEMNCLEKHVKGEMKSKFPERDLVISRTANLTEGKKGRGPCQHRDLCKRGCPFGGYFSSNSATLPAAKETGNLEMKVNSVVHSILIDPVSSKATGVRVIDTHTKEVSEYYAKIIFLNAATLNSTLVLLNSTSERYPNGLGNDSGVLGENLMDHNYNARVQGDFDGFEDQYYEGKRPTSTYLPRFRNFKGDKQTDFLRGYAYSCGGFRTKGTGEQRFLVGDSLMNNLMQVGPWKFNMLGMGECLPYKENKVTLSTSKKDQWGIPLLNIDAEYKANELNMQKDMVNAGMEMLNALGFKNVRDMGERRNFGLNIHEMGTARMGRDPKTSVLNGFNQVWGTPNVYVTDGACMTSSGCQNPSLTYMALTARAVDHAVSELNKQNL
ncbi:GMC family oxidoreductase [Euzebyella marina]|uniref:GMC family oxidoreductase n=1 Tax=Euzebyella marina TaxID=1761453 RepID=A0A3G2LA47_9FLAO|nr:GMC family oxidoreductase [Euzebyella marina]AYN69083.1 GMC family oxidoreductase [Euzebyella marina]MAU71839.1 GMC family oxidoreductase [Pseudozobellia sp.]MBG50104.1 GMC family oxidoreductase [Pseudozobellia sp.]|tara:strand:- start:589224 stop:590921 length:1698 start_codon:yes stop_codon:yes gene_type:complete